MRARMSADVHGSPLSQPLTLLLLPGFPNQLFHRPACHLIPTLSSVTKVSPTPQIQRHAVMTAYPRALQVRTFARTWHTRENQTRARKGGAHYLRIWNVSVVFVRSRVTEGVTASSKVADLLRTTPRRTLEPRNRPFRNDPGSAISLRSISAYPLRKSAP